MIDLTSIFDYAFFQRAFIGGICAAMLCSVMGVFIVLRRASLIGEGIAHLSFGGIALGLDRICMLLRGTCLRARVCGR